MEDTIYEIDFQDDEAQVSEELESSSALLVKAENVVTNLESLIARLQASKEIDRTTASTIRTLTTGMESMDAHFTKYPVNSYTALASPTNLKPTLEGLVSNLAKAAWNAIKAIFKYIYSMFKDLFGIKNLKSQQMKKVQTVFETEVKLVKNNKNPSPPDKSSSEFKTLLNMICQLPGLASQLASYNGSALAAMTSRGGTASLVNDLAATERKFLEDAHLQLGVLDGALDLLAGEAGKQEVFVASFVEGILEKGRTFTGVGYLGGTFTPAGIVPTFGNVACENLKSVKRQFAMLEPIKYTEQDLDLPAYLANLIFQLETSGISKVKFASAGDYSKLEDGVRALESRIIAFQKTDGQAIAKYATQLANECRAIINAIYVMEGLINQLRSSLSKLTAIIREYRTTTK